jgi:GAF domain-containing protein
VYFNNPLLPATRSEMALPLKSNEGLIGVLDIQSDQAEAFAQEDIEVMQIMADQLATAIEKTRLLQQVGDSLNELQRTYGQFTGDAWGRFARGGLLGRGFRYSNMGLEQVPDVRQMMEAERAAAGAGNGGPGADPNYTTVPIRLRGQTIGGVRVRFQQEQPTEEMVTVIQHIADRVATALENARLVEDARGRAQREQAITEVSNKIGNVYEVDNILRSITEELGRLLEDSEVVVELVRQNGSHD